MADTDTDTNTGEYLTRILGHGLPSVEEVRLLLDVRGMASALLVSKGRPPVDPVEDGKRVRLMGAVADLADVAAAFHPGSRVGMAVAVSITDWVVYIDGPGRIFGHGLEDVPAALRAIAQPGWSWERGGKFGGGELLGEARR